MTDWYDVTEAPHERTFEHEGRLDSLLHEWERELAALWRLEADVNNGAYLQFLSNWGYETYVYASQALKKIGAHRMAEIVDRCQALVDEHIDSQAASHEQLQSLMPNELHGQDGKVLKKAGSALPKDVLDEIYDLSYEFMDYPDDISELGLSFYANHLKETG